MADEATAHMQKTIPTLKQPMSLCVLSLLLFVPLQVTSSDSMSMKEHVTSSDSMSVKECSCQSQAHPLCSVC